MDNKYESKVTEAGRKFRIIHAIPHTAQTRIGTIFVQEIALETICICLSIFFIIRPGHLYPFVTTPTLALHYMLKGKIEAELEGVGVIMLLNGKYRMFYLPKGSQKAWFAKAGTYVSFHVEFSKKYLEMLAVDHAPSQELLDSIDMAHIEGKYLQVLDIDYDIGAILKDIMSSRKAGLAFRLEQEANVLKLLSRFEEALYNIEKDNTTNSTGNDLPIREIEEYILENLTDIRLSVAQIATQFQINIRTLERLYKKRKNRSITEFYQRERMKKALHYVTKTNTPIKAIAYDTGYETPSSFTRIFKVYFHCTP